MTGSEVMPSGNYIDFHSEITSEITKVTNSGFIQGDSAECLHKCLVWLHSLNERLNNAETTITTLETSIQTLDTAIADINTTLESLDNRVTALENPPQ